MEQNRLMTRWTSYGLGVLLSLALAGIVPNGPVAAAPATEAAPVERAARDGVVRLADSSVSAGQRVKVRGRVPHGKRKVRVQVRPAGGKWRKVATTRSKKGGKFAVKFAAPSRSGKHQVRALAPRAKVRGKRRGRVVTRAVRLMVVPSSAALKVRAQEAAVLQLVNAERAKAGCGPVAHQPRLHLAARGHSADMARTGVLSHVGSDGSTSDQRATRAGYRWSLVGENVAAGYPNAASVMAGWMKSEVHRDNILHCGFVHLGVGRVVSRTGLPYWTQVFGRPL